MTWFIYIIACSDHSLYTGITNDPVRRFRQHAGRRGAKYFRGRHPQRIVYLESSHDRSSAARREIEIKKLSRAAKLRLLSADSNRITEGTDEISAAYVSGA